VPGTAPGVATTPTVADLAMLRSKNGALLRVSEVADKLGVCNATVYRLCERSDLKHIRIVNSIRIRVSDLRACLAKKR
jgi:excisionase family DNA binding protein